MTKLDLLFKKALEVRQNAYAPYSGFKVGAAVLSQGDQIYVGANTENVSYPCGTCAEQSAICAMVANGEYKISDIVIVAQSKNLITPCGACLQRIAQFATADTKIHLADVSGIKKSCHLKDLLPTAFREDLEK